MSLDQEQFATAFADSPPVPEPNFDLPADQTLVPPAEVLGPQAGPSDKVRFNQFGSNLFLISDDHLIRLQEQYSQNI